MNAVACMTRWIHRYPKIPITTDGTARITIHCGMRQRAGHAGHGLGLDDQAGGDEPDVENQHRREHERRPVEPELPPALDRLRHAEPRPLGGVQCDQQRAD